MLLSVSPLALSHTLENPGLKICKGNMLNRITMWASNSIPSYTPERTENSFQTKTCTQMFIQHDSQNPKGRNT